MPTFPVDPGAGSDGPTCNPAVNKANQVPHTPKKDKKHKKAFKEHGTDPDEREIDEDDVLGEAERPAPHSEKPQAP